VEDDGIYSFQESGGKRFAPAEAQGRPVQPVGIRDTHWANPNVDAVEKENGVVTRRGKKA